MDKLFDTFQQFLALQCRHAIIEGAHPGQHRPARLAKLFGPSQNLDIRTHLAQGLFHAAQVA